jgi:hypothetical protein
VSSGRISGTDRSHPGLDEIWKSKGQCPLQHTADSRHWCYFGDQQYPSMDDVKTWVDELSAACWFLDATEKALELGNSILGNIMMIGALAGTGALPLDRAEFETVIAETMPADKAAINLKAYDMGYEMVR